MPELLARAEFVDKLQAVCHRCGGPATTQRLVDGRPAPYSGETIVVGASTTTRRAAATATSPGPTRFSSSRGRRFAPPSRSAIQIAFRSVNFSSAWIDLSRPKPDCLKPPNGLEMSPASNVFTHTMPARIARAALCATLTSSVQIPAEAVDRVVRDRDRVVELENVIAESTGPKISSRAIVMSFETASKIVGST